MTDAPEYSVDWTSYHFQDWNRWLGHLAGRHCCGVEIGSFEGRSAAWFLEHIVTHPEAVLVCIDPWDYAAEHAIVQGGATDIDTAFDWNQVYRRFLSNTARWSDRRRIVKQPSTSGILQLAQEGSSVDFAFIDGSHIASLVLQDTIMVWPLLRPGAILIWDDYTWTRNRSNSEFADELLRPRAGIDAFLSVYAGRYDSREDSNDQVKICKRC